MSVSNNRKCILCKQNSGRKLYCPDCERRCLYCNNIIIPKEYDYINNFYKLKKQKFCSRNCYFQYKHAISELRKSRRICKNPLCTEHILVTRNSQYCSSMCRRANRDNPRQKKSKQILLFCYDCSKPFVRKNMPRNNPPVRYRSCTRCGSIKTERIKT